MPSIDSERQGWYNTDMRKTVFTFRQIAPAFIVVFLFALLINLSGCALQGENNADDRQKNLLPVWQWDNRLDSSYLDFAADNGVTEIYCYYSSFSQKTTDFIAAANSKGIEVLWLAGKYEWVEDLDSLESKIEEFVAFQASSSSRFAGIHLDIEPHQHPEFDERREELITKYVELTFSLSGGFPSLRIEYDIPFWLDDEVTIDGITKPAHEFVIDNAARVTVMSYRDSAEKILDCSKDEINYAKSVGKPLNLSVETGENSDDVVTFYEEGNAFMLEQLAVVRASLPDDFGIAIHHIKDWKALAER